MTSIARVDKIQKVADSSNIINKTGTDITLGQTGDDIIVPAGATITNNGTAVGFDTDTNDKVKVTTNDTTAGFLTSKILAGTNITLATGSPGGNETLTINTSPSLEWQTSIVTATTLTAVAGKGYWINTTSNVCTITLPASASVGDQLIFVDYARTWATNAVTINQNSLNFQGNTSPNPIYNTSGQTVNIVYSGATKGWIPVSDDDVTLETAQTTTIEYLVVAGGGAGANKNYAGGGGGAGGYRTNYGGSALTINKSQVYTATVGAGGTIDTSTASGPNTNGADSSLSGSGITTITSTGGGAGANNYDGSRAVGNTGGSGGGGASGAFQGLGGAGNTPSTSPSQGNNGGQGQLNSMGGGGGGASVVGGSAGGAGGNGTSNSITGAAVTYAGGGGGCNYPSGTTAGGTGGGGAGSYNSGSPGTNGLGGGGGGSERGASTAGGIGGSGVVIIRVATSDYSGTTSGSPTITTDGSDTVISFAATGTYTA